jgi:hypothetical protein
MRASPQRTSASPTTCGWRVIDRLRFRPTPRATPLARFMAQDGVIQALWKASCWREFRQPEFLNLGTAKDVGSRHGFTLAHGFSERRIHVQQMFLWYATAWPRMRLGNAVRVESYCYGLAARLPSCPPFLSLCCRASENRT